MQRHDARLLLQLCAFLALVLPAAPGFADEDPDEHAHEHEHEEHGPTEEIVITASPLAHRAEELALPVDQLDRTEILQDLGTTIGNTLRNVPGVTSTGFAGGASRPVIRGQDAFRTEVLESGLSTHDVSRLSPDHAVPVNPLAAQYLEVVRGPGVLRYGGGASAGVVNAITNRVPGRLPGTRFTGEVVGMYGENADERDLAVRLEGDMEAADYGEVAWHFDSLLRKSDDYKTGTGATQQGTDTDTFSASGGAAWFYGPARVGFAYTRFESDYGIPEADEPVQIDMHTDRYRFEGDWDAPASGIRRITFRGVYSDYTHDEKADGMVGQTFDNEEFDGRLELVHDGILGFAGAVGLHGRAQDFKAEGEAAEFLDPSDTESIALYLFEERELTDSLDLELGFRTEGVWVDGRPISGRKRNRSFAPVSGSVGLVANPDPAWSIGALVLVGQRAPSQVELFASGPHEATGTFEIGDDDFDEETSYTGELRVTGQVDRVSIEAATFITHYDDFIYGRLTGVTVDEDGDPAGDELDQLFYTARNALFYGGEARVGIELFELCGGVVGAVSQFDFVRARFTSGGNDKNVPRITPIRWGSSLTYEHERVSGRFGFLRTEKQRHGSDNEFETRGFWMLDLDTRYRLPVFEEVVPLELAMSARNLLNQQARNAVSFNKDEVRLPGRSFLFSIHGRF